MIDIKKMFEENRERNKEQIKGYLKQRINVQCKCKKQILREKDRVKYGVCSCDAYSMYYSLGRVIHNYLVQYLADARPIIKRDDWDKIEGCAKSIKEYIEADSWDYGSSKRGVKSAYIKKEKEFKKSMKYIVDNWNTFWW